ncbi:MAG: ATP synthase F1 subunit epsilon [Acidimicrobiales bacterium]
MSLQVQVVSPERILWSGDAESVTCRTVDGGDIAFLNGHAPFVGALEIGLVTIRPDEGEDLVLAVHGGFVEVSNNEVSLLSDVAETADQIDADRARQALDRAQGAVQSDSDDEEAAAAVRRAEIRLQAAGASVS